MPNTVLLLDVSEVLEDALSRTNHDARRLCMRSTIETIQYHWRQWAMENAAADSAALVLYLTVGWGLPEQTTDVIQALAAGGWHVVEMFNASEYGPVEDFIAAADVFKLWRLGQWPGWRDITPFLRYGRAASVITA